jgi:hypothetical protein
MLYIPLPRDKADYSVRVALDGTEYVLAMQWRSRGGWFLSLSDAAGAFIFGPRKLTPNWNLLASVTDDRRPRGALYCLDRSGAGAAPGRDAIDVTHPIIYLTEEEEAALRA